LLFLPYCRFGDKVIGPRGRAYNVYGVNNDETISIESGLVG